MLKNLRTSIIDHLWQQYCDTNKQMHHLNNCLMKRDIHTSPLDHFAIIDLPGPHSGIPVLRDIFLQLGYQERGKGYLPEKQNDFHWLGDIEGMKGPAAEALAQVVVADFRPDEMPEPIRSIVEKYAAQAQPFPAEITGLLLQRIHNHDEEAATELFNIISNYLKGRDWPLPTKAEFLEVQAFNELLAWVLVFGRQVNHFTLSVHHLNSFSDLETFHEFVESEAKLALNHEGGAIKGGPAVGIAQGSTVGTPEIIQLADGEVELPVGFIEFVWRYPINDSITKPVMWTDYFNDFIPQHADNVIESLYHN